MKTKTGYGLVLIGLAAVTTGALYQLHPKGESVPVVPLELDGGRLQTNTDAEDVFLRAFWQRPQAGDKILHAERREWISDTAGVRRWDWFLAIEPGSTLVEALCRRFLLKETSLSPGAWPISPSWFRTALEGKFKCYAAADQSLVLLVSADGRKLFAAGQGNGFSAAVSEQHRSAAKAAPSGNSGEI